jgi:hypothetical protein
MVAGVAPTTYGNESCGRLTVSADGLSKELPTSRSSARRSMPASGWAALAAVILATAAGLFLALYPVYQGVSESVSSSGAVTSSTDSATLIAENGAWVILLLCVPVALAVVGLMGAVRGPRALVWAPAVVLLVFVLLAGFSIGLFYAPAALALLAAAGLTQAQWGRVGNRVS